MVTSPSVVDQISAAMSITSMRHQVIASNLSNREAQGYQRVSLAFERALGGEAVPRVVPDSVQTAPLESDLLALSTNAMGYQALARVLSRYFAIAGAVAGNRS